MNTEPDVTRIVRSWLRVDEHESADRVLDAVLDQLDTIPQRRVRRWPAWRLSTMNTTMKVGAAAVVVAFAVLAGITYLGKPDIGGPTASTPLAEGAFTVQGAAVELDARRAGAAVSGTMHVADESGAFTVDLECATTTTDGLLIIGGRVAESTHAETTAGTWAAVLLQPGDAVEATLWFEPSSEDCAAQLELIPDDAWTFLEPIDGELHLPGAEAAAERHAIEAGIPRAVSAATPSGWVLSDGWALYGPDGIDPPGGAGIRFFTVANLYADPSSLSAGVQDPPVGPTVADLVAAIVAQDAWIASDPTEAVIGGYPATHITVAIPEDVELVSRGREGPAFYLFEDARQGQVYGWAAGQVFDLYIVDVDGERLVIDAFHFPGTSEADLATLDGIVESIRIATAD